MSNYTEGTFNAVCLSGFISQDNSGASLDVIDGFLSPSDSRLHIIVRPLTTVALFLPSPILYKGSIEDIYNNILLHRNAFLARSHDQFTSTSPISFGQIIQCRFTDGSLQNSNFQGLEYDSPSGDPVYERDFFNLLTPTQQAKLSAARSNWSYAGKIADYFQGSEDLSKPCDKAANVIHLENAMDEFGITNTFARIAILSVIKKESGLCPKSEKMKYSPGRLAEVWSRFSTTKRTVDKGSGTQYANALAYEYAGDPRKLANLVYGGKYGNRPGTNDGFDYRGRGFNQITFRGSYEKYANIIGVDIVSNPDLLNDPSVAAKAAVAFIQNRWKSSNHPEPIYKGSNPQFPNQVTANLWAARANAGWGKGMGSSATIRAIKNTNSSSMQFRAQADGKIILI